MILRRIIKNIFLRHYEKSIRRRAVRIGQGFKVNGKSSINGEVVLGDNVNFNGMSIRGIGKTVIGNNFHSGIDCVILTSNHNYEGDFIPYDTTMIKKMVVIEDNVWIGDNVMILGGSTLGEGCIIQAGSVVSSSIPPCGIAGGNPAKVFKYRDREHYELLKKDAKYL